MNKKQNKKADALLVGLGCDASDGHTRITKGEKFRILGGSEETHDKLTETAVKFNEKLSSKGKQMEELSKNEFADILSESIAK
jgi:hypothetical protein